MKKNFSFKMQNVSKILVAGALHYDETLFIEHSIQQGLQGDMVGIRSVRHTLGGKGAAQALALHSLGHKPYFAAAYADDTISALLQDFLKKKNISLIPTHALHTAKAYIVVDPGGRNMIAIYANEGPRVEDVSEDVWGHVGALIVQQEGSCTRRLGWVDQAKKRHIPVFLNAAPCWSVPREEILKNVHTIIMNRVEAHQCMGNMCDDALAEHIGQFHQRYGCDVMITLGSQGAIGGNSQEVRRTQSVQRHVTDSTGAGDMFVGAFVHAFVSGCSLSERLQFACYVAGVACGLRGKNEGLYPYPEHWAQDLSIPYVLSKAPKVVKER